MKAFEWTNPTTVNEAVKMLTVAAPGDIDEAPRPGIRGSRVAFVHPSAAGGVLTEIVQPATLHRHE